jgi:putative ABC transport system substrate-binding protein
MKRRALLMGGAASAALAATRGLAQQPAPKVALVGFLSASSAELHAANRREVSNGFRALGWIEGTNLRIEERYANTRMEDLPRLAEELLRSKPDVIICIGPAAALAVKKAASDVPVVFAGVADPVGLGLANSLGRPGDNFTGFATIVPETFFAKQMELLRETVPQASRVALLTNPGNPIHTAGRDLRVKAARDKAFEVLELQAKTREELEKAFVAASRQRADAMIVSGDPLALAHRQLVAELALNHRLPVMFLFHQHVDAGGLMSYGSDLADLHRRAAGYADRILKGAKPADLPIEQPTKFELVINLKAARAIGLTVPPALLVRADRVIE